MNEFKFAPSPADEPTGTYLAQIRCVLAIEAGQEYAHPRGACTGDTDRKR